MSYAVKAVVLLASLSILASCGLPRSGPTKREVLAASVDAKGDAHIVPVTRAVSAATAVQPSFGFSAAFREAGLVGADTIAPGGDERHPIWV